MSLLANSNAIETGGYQISRSVRFRSSANGNFTRTPSSATNRRTWTWSAWVKRGLLSSGEQVLFSAGSSYTTQTYFTFYIGSDNKLVTSTGTAEIWRTTQVFRDPSAWYHVVLVVDTTQATADNRTRLYVNGAEVTSFTRGTNLSLNTDYGINYNIIHYIGRDWFQPIYFDGYMTEVNFIDGQALTPSSFGETDTITGSWVAKKYTGTYGTNGFYLNFSDNSAATSTTIGKDYSGNGNNWTPNNISVTAGTTYDSMLDVPSGNGYADGGNGRGNYATLNPTIANTTNLINANLTRNGAVRTNVASVICFNGKYYFETTIQDANGNGGVGVKQSTAYPLESYDTSKCATYFSNGEYKIEGGAQTAGFATYTNGDVIGIAIDTTLATPKIWFSKNGTWQGTGDPTTAGYSLTAGLDYYFMVLHGSGASSTTASANFGQRPFSYTPPTGFKALNTTNLSDPTVKKGSSYFDINLRTANGSTTTVTGIPFAPDLVWVKARNNVMSHNLFDRVRGAQNALYSNLTDAETSTTNLTAFTGDGYTVGNSLVLNTYTFVDWLWKANGAGVTNTAGSITSTVSANTTSGFAIATTTGAGGTGTIGHGLGAVPQFIMCFRRNTAADHYCYHQAIGNTNFLVLNTTAASAASANLWNNTTPTSTVFSVGNTNNNSGDTYVHYIFAPVPGYSAFGSYTGNGSTDGPFVYCGFRPRYVMIKRTDTTGNWRVWDTSRSTYNVAAATLLPNSSGAELTTSNENFDILSNGFKLRNADSEQNASGGTYIYAAFAENPFKYSNAR